MTVLDRTRLQGRESRHGLTGLRRFLRHKAQRFSTRFFGPIRRLAIRVGKVREMPGAEVREWDLGGGPVETPLATKMQMHPLARDMSRPKYVPPPPFTALLPRVYFAPRYHALFNSRRELLADSVSTSSDPRFVSLAHLWRARSVDLSGLYSTFRSHHNSHFHTLIDNLPRLYLLELLQPSLDIEVQLLYAGELSRAEAYLLPRLLPEGARLRSVPDDRLFKLERFAFLSFLTRRFSGWLPPACLEWYRESVVPSRPPRRSRRILLSRAPTERRSFRSILNEDELMESLGPLGFERWVPEELDFAQQIELFHDAEFVIGAHGAGLANLVFGRNIRVIELFPSRWVVPHYYLLSIACGHRYGYWCGSAAHRNADFSVDRAQIMRIVRDLEA